MKNYVKPSIEEVKLLKEDVMKDSLFFEYGAEDKPEDFNPPVPEYGN